MSLLDSIYVELENDNHFKVVLSTYGAGVRKLELNNKPLILELEDNKAYLESTQFFGKTVGRVIGRLSADRLLNGERLNYPYDTQDGIVLHSGCKDAFCYQPFECSLKENEEEFIAEFTRVSPDLECGFPGNLFLIVRYILSKKQNDLTIEFEAISDKDTFVSVSNHMYWNIFGQNNIDEDTLQIKASKTCVFKEGTQLVVDKCPVEGCFDFRDETKLSVALDEVEKVGIKNLDHYFFFDDKDSNTPKVILKGNEQTISCYTDFDACNFYVDSTCSNVKFISNDNLTHNVRRGLAIEPQTDPLSEEMILKKGMKWKHFIKYTIR